MTEQDLLYRMWRLVQYKRFRIPSLEELLEGLEYEYASSIINHVPNWKYGKWGSPWGFVHKDYLEKALQDSNVRTLVPLPTKYLLELLQEYPLEFEYNGMNIIVTPSGNRTVYVNGHDQVRLPDSISEKWFNQPKNDFYKDWEYLLLGQHKHIETKATDVLYKYFKGICTNVKERVNKTKEIQNLIKPNMKTDELRDLLNEHPLHFEFEGLDIIAMPYDKYMENDVFVNGKHQRSLPLQGEVHAKWFGPMSPFKREWRYLLKLDTLTSNPHQTDNSLATYYKGIVRSPYDIAKDIIISLTSKKVA